MYAFAIVDRASHLADLPLETEEAELLARMGHDHVVIAQVGQRLTPEGARGRAHYDRRTVGPKAVLTARRTAALVSAL
jgi:hypothetical protein